MTPGAHLNHAVRLAGEAERLLVTAAIHLDEADVDPAEIDAIVDQLEEPPDLGGIIEEVGFTTVYLQRFADAYGLLHVRLPDQSVPEDAA